VKSVAQALHHVERSLERLREADALDQKLAEYAFFPLTHIFNEAPRLSSQCLESAVHSVSILVLQGWRHHLAPQLGKQLLILMTLVAGSDAKKRLEPASEDLKVAAFQCINALVIELTNRADALRMFDDVGSKSIVDQLAYCLLESVAEATSDQVQHAAAEALLTLVASISDRVLLASLLPRTASSLTHSLRTSTKARRTRKVLIAYLKLLKHMLRVVLGDDVAYPIVNSEEPSGKVELAPESALDETWLRATATQVNLVVVQVLKLRNHEHAAVRQAVADLCLMIITDCPRSLSESLAVAIETIVFIAQRTDGTPLISRLENAAILDPNIIGMLMTKLRDWIQSLPRVMQAIDDKVKQHLFGQIQVSMTIAAHCSHASDEITRSLAFKMLESITALDGPTSSKFQPLLQNPDALSQDLGPSGTNPSKVFAPLILNHSSQLESVVQLNRLVQSLHQNGASNQIARLLIDRISGVSTQEKVSGVWLAMQCLKEADAHDFLLQLEDDHEDDVAISRPRLITDLYAVVLPCLLTDSISDTDSDWRLTALAIECTFMQAKQLEISYRPELLDTLYPILSLLGSGNPYLRSHALTGLNLLAKACQYPSTSDMLIDNADYLINAVGMKLNAFDVSPQAPQVLLMMLRLCGARIVPYLDDLVGSMFSSLDNFHGYPTLVELLFQVLKVIVDESKTAPHLAVTNGLSSPNYQKVIDEPSQISDVLDDLRKRSARKRKTYSHVGDAADAAHRPWTSFESRIQEIEGRESESPGGQDEEQEKQTLTRGDGRTLSKPHQLLLNIATATSPHLTSPSPKVRSILLQLLDDISPLLAQDENTFLPLINSVWPAVVQRLLDYGDDPSDAETAYNICAAAETIATFCRDAGSFMSSRIDEIFPKLRTLFGRVRSHSKLKGAVRQKATDTKAVAPPTYDVRMSSMRSSESSILAALTRMLAAVLTFVRVSADVGDEIVAMLAALAHRPANGYVKVALHSYNADALWLWTMLSESAEMDSLPNKTSSQGGSSPSAG
jgi:TELO2-interacting protein 1